MSISPISLTYPAPQQPTTSVRAQAFSDLANSLQSGNLQGAQQAYGILEQLQGNQASSSSSGSTGTSANNPIATDFAALGQALSSGNLTQAQSDFQQLQTALQSAPQTGSSSGATGTEVHHHHHGGEMEPGGGSAPTPILVSPTLNGISTSSDGSTTTGGSVNLLA
jgi:hypothetical protein